MAFEIKQQPSALKITGRCGSGTIKAIVLHELDVPKDELDLRHQECASECLFPCTSYHFGLDAGTGAATQYVPVADQSITYIDPVNLDPTSIALVGEAVGTSANCTTINVALATPTAMVRGRLDCGPKCDVGTAGYAGLVKLLAKVIEDNGLTVNTIIKAGNAVAPTAGSPCPAGGYDACNRGPKCIDLDKLKADVQAEIDAVEPPPLLPPYCHTLTISGTTITLTPSSPDCPPSEVDLPISPAPTLAFGTAGNTATVTYNAVSYPAPIINSNVLAITAPATLTSIVNGITASVDLAPLLDTTHTVTAGPAATEFTSTVNGIDAIFDIAPLVDAALCPALQAVTPVTSAAATDQLLVVNGAGCGLITLADLLPLIVFDDQTLTSGDGNIIFTPSTPAGGDNQVNYTVSLKPTYVCDTLKAFPFSEISFVAGWDIDGNCVHNEYPSSSGVGIKGFGVMAAPYEFEASDLPVEAVPGATVDYVVTSTAANPDGALIKVSDLVCVGLNSFSVVGYDPALPLQFLQKDVAGVCQIVEIDPVDMTDCKVEDRALTPNGIKRVRPAFATVTVGGGLIDPTLADHYKVQGDVTVAVPVCPRQIRITNLEPSGAAITVTLTQLNGVADVITLPGFATPGFTQFVTATGSTRQGASVSLDIDASGNATIF